MIPKLEKFKGPEGWMIWGEDEDLTEAQATEIIRIVEAHEGLVKLLRYFYELPSSGARNQGEHCAKLKQAEQAIAGEPK